MKTITKTELAQIIADLLGHCSERVTLHRGKFVPTTHPINGAIAKARAAIVTVQLETSAQEHGLSPAETAALLAD